MELYPIHARVKKAIRVANDLYKQGFTHDQLMALSPEEKAKALGKHSEETFKSIAFELRGLETGKVKPEGGATMETPSQPQQAKAKQLAWPPEKPQAVASPSAQSPSSPKAAPLSHAAQRLYDTLGKLESTPDVPVSIARLRNALPDLSKEQLDQAAHELRKRRMVYPSTHDHPAALSDEERAHGLIDSGQLDEQRMTPYNKFWVALSKRSDYQP